MVLPAHLDADLCVIGSGPGGGMVSLVAAEAGLRVVLLEAGGFIPPERMTQREEEMAPQLYWENGARLSRDRNVLIHQGRGLGGSSLHNLNLCKRMPDPLLAQWCRDPGLEHLPPALWQSLYEEVEALLQVSTVHRDWWNAHNRLLETACLELGWAGGGLRHNRTGCTGSGFCELGCVYDAKNNVTKTLLPRATRAGLEVLTRAQAIRVDHAAGRVQGVTALALHPRTHRPLGRVEVRAPRVCVSASATGSAALLLRSEVPDPGQCVGNTLRLHPALIAAGDFDQPVRAWRGVPQTYECTEFLDFTADHSQPGKRTWIVPAFAHPVATATMMPGVGAEHLRLMARYEHLAVFTAMIHDTSAGQVRPRGDLNLRIDYQPDEHDRRELLGGLVACVRLLFAAGARKVYVPGDPVVALKPGDPLDLLTELPISPGSLQLTAVHPMGTLPMGDNPKTAVVDSRGRSFHLDGLWVADASLFPTSIGVPPQLSVYALGLHVGRAIVGEG